MKQNSARQERQADLHSTPSYNTRGTENDSRSAQRRSHTAAWTALLLPGSAREIPREPALMLTTHQHALAVGVTHRGGDALGQLLQQQQHTAQVLACKEAQDGVRATLTGADSAANTQLHCIALNNSGYFMASS